MQVPIAARADPYRFDWVRPHPDQYAKYVVRYRFLPYSHPSRTIICTHSPAQPERWSPQLPNNGPTGSQTSATTPPHGTIGRRFDSRRHASPPLPRLFSPLRTSPASFLPLDAKSGGRWSTGRRLWHCCAAGRRAATLQHSGAPSTGARSPGMQLVLIFYSYSHIW